MPRHGELSKQEKVTSLLAHRGWPKSTLAVLTDEEVAECVEIYDATILPMSSLNERFDKFWERHRKRLDAAKAATDETVKNIEQDAKTAKHSPAKTPSK